MKKFGYKEIRKNKAIIGYYIPELNLFIVGKYETACGGCDSISTQDEICYRIEIALKKGWSVLFEGLICSHIAKRYADIYLKNMSKGITVKYIFLNTPLEVCKENINKRRIKAGKEPTNAKNTEKDYTSTKRSRKNMHELGVPNKDMPIMSSKDSYRYVISQLTDNTNK